MDEQSGPPPQHTWAWHKKVNIGLAWDKYNFLAFQHFEGDYVEYVSLPTIERSRITLEGRVKNGARFGHGDLISVVISYDPPPHSLTRGQLTSTYCYDSGRPIAYLREPLPGGWYYPDDEKISTYRPCPDPYEVPSDAEAPASHEEAHEHWERAYSLSQSVIDVPIIMDAITATKWRVNGGGFSITADLRDVLDAHGPGVYTVVLWGTLDGESEMISIYSIFHDIPRPTGYD